MNDADRELEALRRAFREREGEPPEGDDAPSSEEILRASLGEASPEEARRVAEHVARSPASAAAWRLAQELEPEMGRAAGATRAGRAHSWRWTLAIATAAAALLAVVLLRPQGGPPADEPVYRDTAAEAAAIRPFEGSDLLAREGAILAWSDAGAAEGTRYDVALLDDELAPLVEVFDLERPRYELPPEILAGRPPGSVVFWRVVATDADGTRRASRTFQSRLE